MQTFELLLKNYKTRLYDRFAILLFALNGLAICFFLYRHYEATGNNKTGLYTGIFALLTIIIYVSLPAKRKTESYFLFAAVAIALYWFWMGYWWISLALLVIFFLYTVSKRPLKVSISGSFIVYPSFPKREINWTELNNVILKDGLLTIDFKNNRIIQQLVDERFPAVNEKEFNDFCSMQLRKATTSQPI